VLTWASLTSGAASWTGEAALAASEDIVMVCGDVSVGRV
jgi:hypothetical protein